MITAEHVVSLIRAHASGDNRRFHSVAIQVAASLAREGNAVGARKIKEASDKARLKTDLPAYSGPFNACIKCKTSPNSVEPHPVKAKYMRENDVEFMERECFACGFTWYEHCGDVITEEDNEDG